MVAGQDERGREVRARLLAGALLAAALAAPAPAGAAGETGRLLVTLRPSPAARAAASDVARAAGARVHRAVPRLRLVTVRPAGSPRAAARALRRDPRVAAVEAERRASPRYEPSDPAYARLDPVTGTTMQWWAPRLGLPEAWDLSRGAGARVAVIDTGVEASHPDLAGKVLASLDADDAVDGPSTQDPVGHGTHVASLACAAADNGVGIAGAGLGCGLLVARSDLTDTSVARSIVWAADMGAHAIVMAFGTDGGDAPAPIVAAVDHAISRGAVLVAAAADVPVEDQGYPASLLQPTGTGPDPAAGRGLSVTAADFGDARADFAGRGTQVSVASYGTFEEQRRPAGIIGAFPAAETPYERIQLVPPRPGCGCREVLDGDRRYGRLQGTSMAAPVVGAAAALARVLNPDLGSLEVAALVKATARRPAGAGWGPELGWGILDAAALTARAASADRRPPSSRVRRLRRARVRSASVRLSWSGRDTAAPGVPPSGVTRYELWRGLDGRPMRRIASTRATTRRVPLRAGRHHTFATVAVDAAGNRERLPARPDVVVRRVR